jgi:hypothetical protein
VCLHRHESHLQPGEIDLLAAPADLSELTISNARLYQACFCD